MWYWACPQHLTSVSSWDPVVYLCSLSKTQAHRAWPQITDRSQQVEKSGLASGTAPLGIRV